MAGFSLDKVYVRSRRVAGKTPCAAEFAAMLACWSSRGDLVNVGACAETATALSSCMQAKVRTPHPPIPDARPVA